MNRPKNNFNLFNLLNEAENLAKSDSLEILNKPFKSEAQRRYFYSQSPKPGSDITPAMVQKWEQHTGDKKLPEKMEKGLRGDWKKEGYIIGHKTDRSGKITVFSFHPSDRTKLVGLTTFHPNQMKPNQTYVSPDHQRKGIATGMYQYAEKLTGKKMQPGNEQTNEGKALWAGPQRSFGKSHSEILNKSAFNKDLKRIQNRSHPKGLETVDHSGYPESHHKEYVDFLNDNNPQKDTSNKFGGISAKMIHKVGDNTYMAKPFHKNIESKTRAWNQFHILGWATMTTKKMYDAANLSHLCEDVSVHTHNKTPMTVHKFDNNVEGLDGHSYFSDKANKKSDLQAKQIAVLDYLSNNMDRHVGNLMVNKDNGDLLAVDHERSFQYLPHMTDNPHNYLFGRAMGRFPLESGQKYQQTPELEEWWRNNNEKIRESVLKETEKIKDPFVKDHVSKNFQVSYDHLNNLMATGRTFDWTAKGPELNKTRKPKVSIKQILGELPVDNMEAIKIIDKSMSKKLAKNSADALRDEWERRVSALSPGEVAAYYSSKPYHHIENHSHGATFGLLNLVHRNSNINHINAMLGIEDLTPFWQDRYKERLDDLRKK